MEERGANVDEVDRTRVVSGGRLLLVDEFEMPIAFTNENYRAHFDLFRQSTGSEGQHYAEYAYQAAT